MEDKFSVISDLHIKEVGDKGHRCLVEFLTHEDVLANKTIYLLGDIFDLLLGKHDQYLIKYFEIFELLKAFEEVHFFEGNHDLHFQKLLGKISDKFGIRKNVFHYHQGPIEKQIGGKKVYITHGDELDVNDRTYQTYKKILSTKFIHTLANYVVPYDALCFIGENASKLSRRQGGKNFDENLTRKKCIKNAKRWFETYGHDIIIAGHTHLKEDLELNIFGLDKRYINLGFPQSDREFLSVSPTKIQFKSLNVAKDS